MKWLQSLAKIVIDPIRCPNCNEEFTKYEYELDKEGNPTSEYPDANNHSIDSVRYGMERVWRRRGL
jgi:phage terminase large subunit